MPFRYLPFPASRRIIADVGQVSGRRSAIHGLIEVDVTEARRRISATPGTTVTGFVAACVGVAAAEHPGVHALRDLRGRLALPDTVDVNVSVEVEIEGRSFPMNHVLRSCDRRAPAELSAELAGIKHSPASSPTMRLAGPARWFFRMPGLLRRAGLRLLRRLPETQQRLSGTISVTSVGMFGRGGGWGIALQVHTLNVVVGGIAVRPGLVDGAVEPREMLHLTVSFDHDIVDGAPAARFTARLRELMEEAAGL
jgi:pyruvate/2-oxoglutarate dehydrogenase complex dihydrolipoamide acyltransferase (E2) component